MHYKNVYLQPYKLINQGHPKKFYLETKPKKKKTTFSLVYVRLKGKHALAALGIWGPSFPFLHAWPLVPSSDTGHPLFSHLFFPIELRKAAIYTSILKSQRHWIMSFKSILALKLCYNSAGEVFQLINTFRAVATRWKEFGTEPGCCHVPLQWGTKSLKLIFRVIEEKRSWH